jgi:hypothetical protein
MVKVIKKAAIGTAVMTMAIGLCASTALAATPNWDGVTPENGEITSPTTSTTVPVNGYVGEAGAIDEDGVTSHEVNVSVPTKVMWAAFETSDSDSGSITAPEYKIRNNSRTNALKVTLTSFNKADGNTANTEVDKNLTLNLTGNLAKEEIVKGNGSAATYTINNTTAFTGSLATQADWNFSLDGQYTGSYDGAKSPTYNMVFSFAKAS